MGRRKQKKNGRNLGIGAPAEDETAEEHEAEVESAVAKGAKSALREVFLGAMVITVGGLSWYYIQKWLSQREQDRARQERELFGEENALPPANVPNPPFIPQPMAMPVQASPMGTDTVTVTIPASAVQMAGVEQ